MGGKWATKLAVLLLKSSRIGNEERQLLTSALLDKLGALPLRGRITMDETGQIFVNGKQMDFETAKLFHESATSMIRNFARRFVREQVIFMAIQKGVHENISPEQGLFAKAALWFYQEEEELYRQFAQADVTAE